jgi:hypothetical protein
MVVGLLKTSSFAEPQYVSVDYDSGFPKTKTSNDWQRSSHDSECARTFECVVYHIDCERQEVFADPKVGMGGIDVERRCGSDGTAELRAKGWTSLQTRAYVRTWVTPIRFPDGVAPTNLECDNKSNQAQAQNTTTPHHSQHKTAKTNATTH